MPCLAALNQATGRVRNGFLAAGTLASIVPFGRPANMIAPGTIFVRRTTPRPACLLPENESGPDSWLEIRQTQSPYDLEREIATSGWGFSHAATHIRATACAVNRAKTLHAAIRRIIRDLERQKYNALEIDELSAHSFLGIP